MRAASDRQVGGSKPSEPFNYEQDGPRRMRWFMAGVLLVAAGAAWAGVLFAGLPSEGAAMDLGAGQSGSVRVALPGDGPGYYVIHMPEFDGRGAFVQVADPRGNVIAEEMVRTRMAAGYFDYDSGGTHQVRITNPSDDVLRVEAEAGEAGAFVMAPPGGLVVAGSVILMGAAYQRLARHSMAQPDPNTS